MLNIPHPLHHPECMNASAASDFVSTVVPDTGSAATPCHVGILPPLPDSTSVLKHLAAALARAEATEIDAEAYRRAAISERSTARSMAYQPGRCQMELATSLARGRPQAHSQEDAKRHQVDLATLQQRSPAERRA